MNVLRRIKVHALKPARQRSATFILIDIRSNGLQRKRRTLRLKSVDHQRVIYQEIPLVDSVRLSELSMMDDEGGFVRELVDLFVSDSSNSMSELEQALRSKDLTNV